MNQKVFLIGTPPGTADSLLDLNHLLEHKWHISEVHSSTTSATWLVIAQENEEPVRAQGGLVSHESKVGF